MNTIKLKNSLLIFLIAGLVLFFCFSPVIEKYLEIIEITVVEMFSIEVELDIFLRFLIIVIGVVIYRKLKFKR
jgi:hypothetical protein|tara:strand:- start:196 stop:414 length:219 start_codon:yes stop_codon:yes gene_type:complete